jgi:hypothetical protein
MVVISDFDKESMLGGAEDILLQKVSSNQVLVVNDGH